VSTRVSSAVTQWTRIYMPPSPPFLHLVLLLLVLGPPPVRAWSADKTNFLFVMYDDLRPELSVYGNSHMLTPNFERLARRSVVFDYGE
jgi:hypothetical protein